MPESENTRKAVIRIEVEYCSQCPKSRIFPIHGAPVLKENVYCTELKRDVYVALDWKEIKAEHQCLDPEFDNSMDFVPEDCPFIKKGITKQMEEIWKN